MTEHVLLLVTVGGTPEPIIAALLHWKPARVVFLPSPDTEPLIEAQIIPGAAQKDLLLNPGCLDLLMIDDKQDFAACVRRLTRLDDEVRKWRGRGDDYSVVVDFTGGTKCMSAALALVARRWICRFSYVGGTLRTKESGGRVVSGMEQIVYQANPWNTLGYQAVDDACTLFNQNHFAAAHNAIDDALPGITEPSAKRELQALGKLIDAHAAWDRFDHKKASEMLRAVAQNANDLRAVFGQQTTDDLLKTVRSHQDLVDQLVAAAGRPSEPLVLDLVANARRRAAEGRFDDAVARLYRAVEALAQARLCDGYHIDTASVQLSDLPEPARAEWGKKAQHDQLQLGLQEAYRLLLHLRDPLGDRFRGSPLAGDKSILSERNVSILAHGFKPVSEKTFKQLDKAVAELAGCALGQLPEFPTLRQAARPQSEDLSPAP